MNYVEKIRKFNRHYANVLGKIDQEIYNHPFPLTEARIMTEINENNGCTATYIIEKLGIDRGYLSRIIQRFDEESIIVKVQSPEDKRQYSLHLTNKGKEIYNKLVNDANIGVEKMIKNLSNTEVQVLVKSMQSIESIFSLNQTPNVDVSIRPFIPGDVGYVAYIHGKIYSTTYQFGRIFEFYVMKGLSEFLMNPEGGELWVAEVNGEIVGSIAITKANESVAQLRWFVLDEKYQGLGIGKKLIETALNFCRENHYNYVFLWTVSTLETARYLYKKYNFTLTEEKPNFEWTGSKLIEERWDLVLTKNE
ncbi:helix-turn-helix domain-containing GNAT family N-acetyltransferase [Bacillus sp. AFS041924]|uniref:bifunctional helix-turn-helix transcriptional regulator/GNAT family N-acetyltransferase n=1 Tax=Bacillus sp. AFS041924 TaxID=2033503 RepID=UPI000BFDE1B1|nr:helix-turn-helix domain-containing GNAT family N-acetyltransferase [Bacillus sp. AFS041924]PGS51704.1 GNAT family N-acetyltransferase [Bacillus sp. AFS041924]